jgi:hypothetical protein
LKGIYLKNSSGITFLFNVIRISPTINWGYKKEHIPSIEAFYEKNDLRTRLSEYYKVRIRGCYGKDPINEYIVRKAGEEDWQLVSLDNSESAGAVRSELLGAICASAIKKYPQEN